MRPGLGYRVECVLLIAFALGCSGQTGGPTAPSVIVGQFATARSSVLDSADARAVVRYRANPTYVRRIVAHEATHVLHRRLNGASGFVVAFILGRWPAQQSSLLRLTTQRELLSLLGIDETTLMRERASTMPP